MGACWLPGSGLVSGLSDCLERAKPKWKGKKQLVLNYNIKFEIYILDYLVHSTLPICCSCCPPRPSTDTGRGYGRSASLCHSRVVLPHTGLHVD